MNPPPGGWPPADPYAPPGGPPGGYPPAYGPQGYGPPPPAGYGPGYYPQPQGQSSNAILALVLSIASWVACGCFTSLPALFIARTELAAIDAGQSPPGGKGMVQAAYWLSIINLVLYGVVILIYGVILVFAVGSSGSMP